MSVSYSAGPLHVTGNHLYLYNTTEESLSGSYASGTFPPGLNQLLANVTYPLGHGLVQYTQIARQGSPRCQTI